jgi:phosphoglycolate phosphatase-like HAD superfamily hydrolase
MTLLIFDIDGTLTDTKEVDDFCFLSVFQDEYKVEMSKVDWTTFTNVTDSGLFFDLYSSVFNKSPTENEKLNFQTKFFIYLDRQLQTATDKFKGVNGAANFVKHCSEREEYKIAFATGGWEYSAKLKLQAASIYYKNIPLSNCNYFYRRQDILMEAIEQSKQHYKTKEFDSVIYFGDGEWDYKTTCELQIPFIGVDINNDKKLNKLGVQDVINDFYDINEILNIIERKQLPLTRIL